MSIQTLLLNGALIEVQVETVELVVEGPFDFFQIVNLGPALVINVSGVKKIKLEYGGTAVVSVDENYGGIALTFEDPEATLNFSEKKFANDLRDTLRRNGCAEELEEEEEDPRRPRHASEVIQTLPDVNMFAGSRGEKRCVAKKRSRANGALGGSWPRIEMGGGGVEEITRRTSHGEAVWRKCAASFSTMMRHFQKAAHMYQWGPGADNQTIIRIL